MRTILLRAPAWCRLLATLAPLLFFSQAVLAQQGYSCATCDDPNTTESQELTANLGHATVTYTVRTCGGYSDLFIKSITPAPGSPWQGKPADELALYTTGLLLYNNPMQFPPANTAGHNRYFWRVVRPSCWYKAPQTGVMLPCPNSPCCKSVVSVYYNDCNSNIFQDEKQEQTPGVCGTWPEGNNVCTNICTGSLIGDFWNYVTTH